MGTVGRRYLITEIRGQSATHFKCFDRVKREETCLRTYSDRRTLCHPEIHCELLRLEGPGVLTAQDVAVFMWGVGVMFDTKVQEPISSQNQQ